MMPDKKLSVNDILDEIEFNRAKAERRTTVGNMQRVDEVIRDILTQRQEEALRREKRQITEQERAELEREIRAQTKTLTKQFIKLKKDQEKRQRLQPPPPPPDQPRDIGYIRVDGTEADIKDRNEPKELVAPSGKPLATLTRTPPRETLVPPQREPAVDEIASAEKGEETLALEAEQREFTQTQQKSHKEKLGRVKAEREAINGHFGNFHMDDTSVDDSYSKTEITPKSYKELKSNRNKKVDSFVLEKQGGAVESPAEGSEEVEDETREVQQEAERHLQDSNRYLEEEYNSPEQNGTVSANLQGLLYHLKTVLIILGAIGINAFLLSFITTGPAAVMLFGRFLLSPLMYAVINLALLTFALVVGRDIFGNVIEGFRKRQHCRDLYYLVAVLACLAVNLVFCFQPGKLLTPGVHLYTPVAVLLLCMNFVSHYQTLSKTVSNFKFVSGDGTKFAVAPVEDLRIAKSMTKGAVDTEPVLAKNVQTNFIDHFLTHSFGSDASDRVMQRSLYLMAPLSLLLGALGWFLTKDWFIAMTMLTGTMVVGGSFVGAVMVSFPLLDTADIVRRFHGMMPDYDTIVSFQDVNSLLIQGSQLFSEEAIKLQSVKTFQGKRIDDVIIDAASVVCAADSALKHVFLGIINQATSVLRPVDSLQYEDLMGMSAWVNEKRVLIGNRELMINHSIPVPKKEFEKQYRDENLEIVYLATEGELSAAFILMFCPDKETADIVRMLEKNDVALIVKTVDSCVTADLLARQFQMRPESFKVIPSHLHKDYEKETVSCERIDSMLGNNGTTFGYIVSLAVTKKLHGCIRLGTLLYLVSAICGVALLTTLLILGKLASFGAMQMLLFLGAFLLTYWVYEKNMRL